VTFDLLTFIAFEKVHLHGCDKSFGAFSFLGSGIKSSVWVGGSFHGPSLAVFSRQRSWLLAHNFALHDISKGLDLPTRLELISQFLSHAVELISQFLSHAVT
jgi:hypothetical protein